MKIDSLVKTPFRPICPPQNGSNRRLEGVEFDKEAFYDGIKIRVYPVCKMRRIPVVAHVMDEAQGPGDVKSHSDREAAVGKLSEPIHNSLALLSWVLIAVKAPVVCAWSIRRVASQKRPGGQEAPKAAVGQRRRQWAC